MVGFDFGCLRLNSNPTPLRNGRPLFCSFVILLPFILIMSELDFCWRQCYENRGKATQKLEKLWQFKVGVSEFWVRWLKFCNIVEFVAPLSSISPEYLEWFQFFRILFALYFWNFWSPKKYTKKQYLIKNI